MIRSLKHLLFFVVIVETGILAEGSLVAVVQAKAGLIQQLQINDCKNRH